MNEKQYYIDIVSSLADRTIKRLWITIILLVLFLFGSNAAWIYYESQWETVNTEVSQEVDTGNGNAIVSGVGDIHYGESATDSQDEIPKP